MRYLLLLSCCSGALVTMQAIADDQSPKTPELEAAALRVELEEERLRRIKAERELQQLRFQAQVAEAEKVIGGMVAGHNIINTRPLAAKSPDIVWHEDMIYLHAPGMLRYSVPRNAKRFKAVGTIQAQGDVRFILRVDGREIFKSGSVRQGGRAEINVEVPAGSQIIELVTDTNGKGAFDQAYWLQPRFEEK